MSGHRRHRRRPSGWRRWTLAVLATALVASCTGGDDGDGDDTDGTGQGTDGTGAGEADWVTDVDTDIGVDLEQGTLTIGMITDLSGASGPRTSAILTGHETYWDAVNSNGGIGGLRVEVDVNDTGGDPDTHRELYETLVDRVVAFGHSTGTAETLALTDSLAEDDVLVVPATRYSGWSDPALDANVLPHGVPYCLETMNLLAYAAGELAEAGNDQPTVAVVTGPDEDGLDAATGAMIAADELGLQVVHDGSGTAGPAEDPELVAEAIADAEPDIVLAATGPDELARAYGAALEHGVEATWAGTGTGYEPALLDSPLAEDVERDFVGSSPTQPWGAGTSGADELEAAFANLRTSTSPSDHYAPGFASAWILHEVLLVALERGDLTQAGVLAATGELDAVDLDDLAPDETYRGEPDERVQRTQIIFRPSIETRRGGGTGTEVVEPAYTSDVVADHRFTGACHLPGG